MSKSRHSLWKLLAIGALALSALVAAYVGFKSAGGAHPILNPALQKTNDKGPAGKRAKGDLLPTKPDGTPGDGSGEDNGPANESEFHRRLKKFFSENDEKALDGLLPMGITKVEGVGGKGMGKQVKSNGKWYPVFDLSHVGGLAEEAAANPAQVQLTKVALAIASPNPPRGMVGQPYVFRFEAIGGTPPYHWAMQVGDGAGGFALDPGTGTLTGLSATPVTAMLNVFVGDTAGGQASTAYSLVIAPEAPLAITSEGLPQAVVNQPYQAMLSAEGGVAPYEWAIMPSSGTWVCDPMTGEISGTPMQAEDVSVVVTLTDRQHATVQKTFDLKVVGGLDIVTESPLPPAAPGNQYTQSFEASGGSMPYTWKVVDGSLPDGWTFSTDGLLSGEASKTENLYQFTVEVTDNGGQTFRKPVQLAVIQALIAVPSRERAGLAWQLASIARSAGSALQSISIERNGPGGSVEVFRGLNTNNLVDHQLVTGASYEYTLTAHTVDGRAVAFGTSRIKILPMTLQRGVPGVTGDPYADRVRSFNPLSPTAYGAAGLPFNVTGPPDGHNALAPAYRETEVASLNAKLGGGLGGSITLEFTDNIVELGPGADFTVFENVMFIQGNPDKRFMEPAIVEVALFEGQWYRFPINVNPPVTGKVDLSKPTYYAQGFAGVNATTGDDPTDPTRSGGDSFDADSLGVPGLTWIRFIRIQSTGHNAMRDLNGVLVQHTDLLGALSGVGSSGFDLDAVSAVNY